MHTRLILNRNNTGGMQMTTPELLCKGPVTSVRHT